MIASIFDKRSSSFLALFSARMIWPVSPRDRCRSLSFATTSCTSAVSLPHPGQTGPWLPCVLPSPPMPSHPHACVISTPPSSPYGTRLFELQHMLARAMTASSGSSVSVIVSHRQQPKQGRPQEMRLKQPARASNAHAHLLSQRANG